MHLVSLVVRPRQSIVAQRPNRHASVLAALIAALAAVAPAGSVADAAPSHATPAVAPNGFVRFVTNPFFPLTPGTTLVYRGSKDGKPGTDIFQVLHRTKMISGVRCTVVSDITVLAGRVFERTEDWYAQDGVGRVWYFGERTAEIGPRGTITSREGSWMDGVNGARRGIFMPAHPRIGQTGQQEFLPGHAEDHFKVKSLSASVTVPFGSFTHALRTKEWTPLEPGVIDAKFYVRGLGEVKEVTVKGPLEVMRLVQIIHA